MYIKNWVTLYNDKIRAITVFIYLWFIADIFLHNSEYKKYK